MTTHERSLFELSDSPNPGDGEFDPAAQMDDLPLFDELDEPAILPAPDDEAEPEAERGPKLFEEPDQTGPVGEAFESDGVIEPALPIELEERPANLTDRLGAALLDLGVMAAVAIVLVLGAMLLGVSPRTDDWPLFFVPWLLFSFLYHVVPTAFWGRTPGMASMSLVARAADGGALSFGQALKRWLATLGTTALLGVPGLLALTGRSTADRVSQSTTLWKSGPDSGD